MVEDGVNPELLLAGRYGNALHVWDLNKRRHLQKLELGPEYQMVLELRPAHNPTESYGFVGVVTSPEGSLGIDLGVVSRGRSWHIRKVIDIPAEPADPAQLPPLLKGFGAVPPLVTDINLSLDDRFLYVSCWGTGEFKQFDVSDPFSPVETGSVRLGGIVRPARRIRQIRTGRSTARRRWSRSAVTAAACTSTNSLYRTWDEQFYPDGIRGWLAKLNVGATGGLELDRRFLMEFDDMRPHQVHLEGGDASSDSYCFA